MQNNQVTEQFANVRLRTDQNDYKRNNLSKVKENLSSDPMAIIQQQMKEAGVSQLEKVEVIVSEDGSTTVGNYKLGRDLGKGTFGKVRVGTHILTEEKVAVKILEKDKIVDTNDVDRVSREIHILKILRHPVVVQLYEIIESENELYLIMEYARGGELFEFIVSHKRVREKEAARFLHQIISGVEYLHKLGICHRDLKPENLLMDDYNNIKIVDFGLSNTYQPGETLKTACGSPCYAAPEMVAGKRYEGLSADIWSCGVILYAMVCGYLPFEDPKTNLLYKKILNAEYTIPDFVSEECADLIKKILNTNPAERYTLDNIKQHSWYKQIKSVKDYSGIIVGSDPIPVDRQIVESILEKYNFQKSLKDASHEISHNRHNSLTTTYYLTLKRFLRQGGKSIADLTKYNPEKVLEQEIEDQLVDTKIQLAVNRLKETQKEIRTRVPSNDGSFLDRQRQNIFPLQQEQSRGHTSSQPSRQTPIQKEKILNKSQILASGPKVVGTPEPTNFNQSRYTGKNQIETDQSVINSDYRTKTGGGTRQRYKAPGNQVTDFSQSFIYQLSPYQNQQFKLSSSNNMKNFGQELIRKNAPYINTQNLLQKASDQFEQVSRQISQQQRQLLQQSQQANMILKQQNQVLPSQLTRQILLNEQMQNFPQVVGKMPQSTQNNYLGNQQLINFSHAQNQLRPPHSNNISGDFSYMYFTPRDLINFKASGKIKLIGSSQPQSNLRRLEDNSYAVSESPANVLNGQTQSTMSRRAKLQTTFFKPGPKPKPQHIVSKSVNTNILEKSFDQIDHLDRKHESFLEIPRQYVSQQTKPATKRYFHFQAQSDFTNPVIGVQSPYQIPPGIQNQNVQKSRAHQQTAQGRVRNINQVNLNQLQDVQKASAISPINVINNSLNITIYSGGSQQPVNQQEMNTQGLSGLNVSKLPKEIPNNTNNYQPRSQTRQRQRTYYVDQFQRTNIQPPVFGMQIQQPDNLQ